MLSAIVSALLIGASFFGSLPATSNYALQSYATASGGQANSSTSTYALEGIVGQATAGQPGSTSNYSSLPAYIQTQQSNVPTVTLSNPSNYYDKLNVVIGQQNNPSDAKYALQVSTTSNFSSGIFYVQTDNTLGATLTTSDYQSYTVWGGATGVNIIGLSPSTTYYIRAKVTQVNSFSGISTESAYGPSSSAATSALSISYCLYTGANCAAGGSTVAFGSITPSTVTAGPVNINVDFATNADTGGSIYIYGLHGGLASTTASSTITSATANLTTAASGFGAQISSSPTQTSGGPLSIDSPYSASSGNVGAVTTIVNPILTSLAPIVGGNSVIVIKAKTAVTTPAATDYSETFTLLAAAAF